MKLTDLINKGTLHSDYGWYDLQDLMEIAEESSNTPIKWVEDISEDGRDILAGFINYDDLNKIEQAFIIS